MKRVPPGVYLPIAVAGTVLGDFDDATFEHDGVSYRCLRDGAVALAAAERAGMRNEPRRERFRFLADRAEGPYNRALMHERRGEPEEADRAYARAIELDPRFSPARFNRGNLLVRLGRFPEAEAQFQAVLGYSPDDPEAHYSLALVLAEQGRYADALPHLRRASVARRRLPDDNDVVYALAVFHRQRNELAEMKRYVEILAIREDPRAGLFR